jgi:hypothetical protein
MPHTLYYNLQKLVFLDCIARNREQATDPSTAFQIDLFVDGVQLFKNSAAAQAYVVLGRIHKVGSNILPIKCARPFIIGIYHGEGGFLFLPFYSTTHHTKKKKTRNL